jgi:hypothetical protein
LGKVEDKHEIMAALAKIKNNDDAIFDLTISRSDLTNSGLPAQRNFTLVMLAKILENNSTLRSLALDCCCVDKVGMQAFCRVIEGNRAITSIYLTGMSVTAEKLETLKIFFEMLKNNKNITSIFLTASSIMDEGVKALAEALQINKNILSIDLQHNQITEEGANILLQALLLSPNILNINLEVKNDISKELKNKIYQLIKTTQLYHFRRLPEDWQKKILDDIFHSATPVGIGFFGCTIQEWQQRPPEVRFERLHFRVCNFIMEKVRELEKNDLSSEPLPSVASFNN